MQLSIQRAATTTNIIEQLIYFTRVNLCRPRGVQSGVFVSDSTTEPQNSDKTQNTNWSQGVDINTSSYVRIEWDSLFYQTPNHRGRHTCVSLWIMGPRECRQHQRHFILPDRIVFYLTESSAVVSPSVRNWMRFFFLVSSRIHSTGCFFRIRLWNGVADEAFACWAEEKNIIQAALWFSNQLCSSGYSSKLMR